MLSLAYTIMAQTMRFLKIFRYKVFVNHSGFFLCVCVEYYDNSKLYPKIGFIGRKQLEGM